MPDLLSPSLWILVAAVFTLGGFFKGAVGLGLPTITMGLLSVVMLPAQAAALLVVPSLITNLWQIGGPGFVALLRRLGTMLAGVCVGVALAPAGSAAVAGPVPRWGWRSSSMRRSGCCTGGCTCGRRSSRGSPRSSA